MNVIKRSGREVQFDEGKIANAIRMASDEVPEDGQLSDEDVDRATAEVVSRCEGMQRIITVEEIQDFVEDALMHAGFFEVAKRYIVYRYVHAEQRASNTTDARVLSLVAGENEEVIEENANKNPVIAASQRDYIAGEVSRDITERLLLPKDVVDAHRKGIIHFHDSDYFVEHITNCELINLDDMLQNGTVIANTLIEKPHSFAVACRITVQIIIQVASNTYGGATISMAHLAKFVDVSRRNIRREIVAELGHNGIEADDAKIDAITEERVDREVAQGLQGIMYGEISLFSTAGQQPFVTFSMDIHEAPEGREREDLAKVIRIFLEQRIKGVKNEQGVWITPTFPKLLYFLNEDNVRPGTRYWYLTQLAAKCTAKRMVPDYVSEKIMRRYKLSKGETEGDGDVYPCMGCVDGDEVVAYRRHGHLHVRSFRRMWESLAPDYDAVRPDPTSTSSYLAIPDGEVEVYDSEAGRFVGCSRVIHNVGSEMLRIAFDGGYVIDCTPDHPFETENRGVVRADELTGEDAIATDLAGFATGGVRFDAALAYRCGEGAAKVGHLPSAVFTWDEKARAAAIDGVIEGAAIDGTTFRANRELAVQMMLLAKSLGRPAGIEDDGDGWKVTIGRGMRPRTTHMTSRARLAGTHDSYDVTTESGHFSFSGLYSHNCRSFLTPDRSGNGYDNVANARNYDGKPKYYGRFNQGVVTINLPYVALMAAKKAKSDGTGAVDEFWTIFDKYLELCHRALRARHERLLGTKSDVAPILWQHGALARLKPGETIDRLLYGGYSTISLGYAGLYEATVALTGHSHTDPDGKPVALAIMRRMNDKCNEWKVAEDIDYSVYGTPLESTTYKFAKALQRDFGMIDGVTTHTYITNSYHVNVREEIDAFSKLGFESEFQRLSPGGAISYVEVPNLNNNVDAVVRVIQFIYDNIMYAELNTKSDYCMECGYDGEMELATDEHNHLSWRCPNCGNADMRKLYIVRRVCGYLGGVSGMNQGRLGDIHDRVLHL